MQNKRVTFCIIITNESYWTIQLAGREQADVDKALSIKAVIWILLSLW